MARLSEHRCYIDLALADNLTATADRREFHSKPFEMPFGSVLANTDCRWRPHSQAIDLH